jgi:cell division protein ZapA (FtsZ GTPase activity inhibitor)
MDKEIQKINVRIGGMSYNLVSLESEQYTRQIAARADEMIRRVAMSGPQLSQQMTIILALTNAVDELTRQATQQSIAEQQRDAAELKNSELRTELTRAREANWEMKKELLRLNALCRQYEAEKPAPPPEIPVAPGKAIPITVATLRQTGMDEYLSAAGQTKSNISEICKDDEP